MSHPTRVIQLTPPESVGCCNDWHWTVLEYNPTPRPEQVTQVIKEDGSIGDYTIPAEPHGGYFNAACGIEQTSLMALDEARKALTELREKDVKQQT